MSDTEYLDAETYLKMCGDAILEDIARDCLELHEQSESNPLDIIATNISKRMRNEF